MKKEGTKQAADEVVTEQEFEEFVHIYSKNKGRPIQIVMEFFKGNTFQLIRSAALLITKEMAVWVLPIITANIINFATTPEGKSPNIIWFNILAAAFFVLLNVVSHYMYARSFYSLLRKIESKLRGAMAIKMQRLSMAFHSKIQSGRLQSKIMRDVENIEMFVRQGFTQVFTIVINILAAVFITLSKNLIVFGFFIIVAPAAGLTVAFFRRRLAKENKEFRKEVETTQAAVAEMIELIPVTRAHGLQNVEIRKMENRFVQIGDKGLRLDTTNTLFGSTSWAVFQLFQVICLGFTGYLAYKHVIQVGDVVMFQSYFTLIVGQVSGLINLYPNITKGMESVNSVGEIITANEMEINNSILPLEHMKGEVEFRNVAFRYAKNEKWILQDFNLHVTPGESIAFVGDSGAGKSTVLNLLIGFNNPEKGKILIDGINMGNLDINEYRSHIAVVPQNTILFSGTIRDNIAYGLEGISDEEINRIVREVGLDDLMAELPAGIYTKLDEHGGNLSGGQRQRLSIARAMVRKPQIIIFDEATSALDSVSEKKVQAATAKMMGSCTTFMVAHRLSTIKDADRIVVMENGRVAEIGKYDELMAKKGKFYQLKKMQE